MTKYTEHLKYEFSDAEIAQFAKELARANARKVSIEQQKKEVDTQLKAEIEVQNSSLARLSAMINAGCEYRLVECDFRMDSPEVGKKTVFRVDTGEDIKVLMMTDADRQMLLDLKNAEGGTAVEVVIPAPGYEGGTRIDMSKVEAAAFTPAPEPEPARVTLINHQAGTKKERAKRSPEAEAYADGSAPVD